MLSGLRQVSLGLGKRRQGIDSARNLYFSSVQILAEGQLRKQDAMEEIRSILGKGVEELALRAPSDFHNSSEQVFENISSAFIQHRSNIDKLKSKKWRFAGIDIGSCLVVGAIEVAAACTGSPVLALATYAADQILDVPKLKNIPSSYKKLAKECNEVKRAPVGILFNVAGNR